MDIQVASNFERLLFDLTQRDGGKVSSYMDDLRDRGGFRVSDVEFAQACQYFNSHRVDEAGTTETMAQVHDDLGLLIDPHTAVALRAARELTDGSPVVTLATAHPAKFPDAVEKATGERPALPAHMSDLYERPERCVVLANDIAVVQAHIDQTLVGR
jgi:threonine synthase